MIGHRGRVAAQARWAGNLVWLPNWPHFAGLSPLDCSGVDVSVFSLCKSDIWTSFYSYFDNPLQKKIITKTHGILLV